MNNIIPLTQVAGKAFRYVSPANDALTHAALLAKLHYDPDTGVFTFRTHHALWKIGCVAGYINKQGYRCINIGQHRYLAHRLAWFYVHGHWPYDQIDHINGLRADNRIVNLRDVLPAVNQQNSKGPRKNNTTGFLGVSKLPRCEVFLAQISENSRSKPISYHRTPEAAHEAYVQEKRRIHAGCTL